MATTNTKTSTTPNPAVTLDPTQTAAKVAMMNADVNKQYVAPPPTQQETIAKAQANPGTLVTGANTGTTPVNGAIAPTATNFQAYTAPAVNPQDQGFLNLQKQREQDAAQLKANQQAELDKATAAGTTSYFDPTTNTWKSGTAPAGTYPTQAPSGAASAAMTVSSTGQTIQDSGLQLLQKQQQSIVDRLNSQQQSINSQFDARARAIAQQNASDSAQSSMMLARMGAFGTTASGVSYMQKLDSAHQAQLSQLEAERQNALFLANDAASKEQLDLAYKQIDRIDKINAEAQKVNAKQLDDLKKYQGIQDKSFDDMAKAGKSLEDFPPDYFKHQDDVLSSFGVPVPEGTSEAIFVAAKKAYDFQSEENEQKKTQAAQDSAIKLINVLDKIPQGKSVNIAGIEYQGLGQGSIKTGTETDENGNVTFWSFDPSTQKTSTTSLGVIGKSQDGWETKFDDNGKPWRINAKTGQFVPFSPSLTQKAWQENVPDGSVSPFTDANGTPRVECGAFANDMTGIGVGDSFESKMQKMNLWQKGAGDLSSVAQKLQTGDCFTQKLGTWTGHVGMVLSVETGPNGEPGIVALESNYPEKGKITSSRFIPLSKIDGFGRGPRLNPALQMGPDASPTFGAKKVSAETLPASVKEYEYAKNQGYSGSFEDWQKRAAASAKPVTLDQSNAAGFAERLKQSTDVFDKLESKLPTAGVSGAFQRALPSTSLTNWMKTTEYQQQEQAERNFINAQLRRESGAAISPQEFDNARAQYFPQPGDSKEVLAQKKENRSLAISNMVRSAGPALSEDYMTKQVKIDAAQLRSKYNY